MAIEDRTRHERLRALFPRAYATDPRDSVLGVLLDALAGGLRSLDRVTERALRDKWLATAEAPREASATVEGMIELGGEPRPLEHLGSALDLLRQPWEVDEQAYRARVARLAPLLTHGLATPRAILSFTIGALGAEICPRLERSGDSTTAFGFPHGRLARCRACRGGQQEPAGACQLRHEDATAIQVRVPMSVRLIDNPLTVARLRRDSLTPGDDGKAVIHFDSDSLFADRPELELKVPIDDAPEFDEQQFDVASFADAIGHVVPSFRSHQTGERIVIAHVLARGDTLTILPQSPYHAPPPPPQPPPHLQPWVDRPASSNPLSPVARVNGVEVPVILFHGVCFDEARFGVDHFVPEGDLPRFDVGTFDGAAFDSAAGSGTLETTTPGVVPGANTWEYAPLDAQAVATVLAALPPGTSLPSPPVVDTADQQPVALRLRWWTRPVARFLLRIPTNPAVDRVVQRGAAAYVRRMVERVRPVGVTATIDFLQQPFRDAVDPSDGLQEVQLALPEPLSPLDVALSEQALPTEILDGLDGASFGGLFDVTLFDFSHFQTQLVELSDTLEPEVHGGFIGVFDATPFEFGLLAE